MSIIELSKRFEIILLLFLSFFEYIDFLDNGIDNAYNRPLTYK